MVSYLSPRLGLASNHADLFNDVECEDEKTFLLGCKRELCNKNIVVSTFRQTPMAHADHKTIQYLT